MFTMLLCFALSWAGGSWSGRRLVRSVHSAEQRTTALRALQVSRAQVESLSVLLGAVCGGELLLECPPLRPQWSVVVAVASYVFAVMIPVLWTEAARPGWERVGGRPRALPSFEEILRTRGLLMLAPCAWFAALGAVSSQALPLMDLGAIYVGYLVITGAISPALLRLALPSRRMDPHEATRVDAIGARYGFDVGTVRVQTGSRGVATNAYVAGLWPRASRVTVTSRMLETFDDDELGFVLAHEAAHRDRWHAAKRVALQLALTVVTTYLALTLLAAPVADTDPLSVMAMLLALPTARGLVVRAYSRRGEREADAVAARTVGVAAAQRSLTRLAVQNGLPLRRSGWAAAMSTHPGTRQRLLAVARAGAATPGVDAPLAVR